MQHSHESYLKLLSDIRNCLDRLTELAKEKDKVVRADDLMALDDVIRKEQAQALALRGLDQKRTEALAALGYSDLPLSRLADHYPDELRPQAKKTADSLLQAYDIYKNAAEVARNTIECNLHEVEKLLAGSGAAQSPAGAGYEQPEVEPPPRMRTDFRA